MCYVAACGKSKTKFCLKSISFRNALAVSVELFAVDVGVSAGEPSGARRAI